MSANWCGTRLLLLYEIYLEKIKAGVAKEIFGMQLMSDSIQLRCVLITSCNFQVSSVATHAYALQT